MRRKVLGWAIASGIALTTHVVLAVDVKVQSDMKFDFTTVKTWAWQPDRPGDVRVARTKEDDPETYRKEAEPIIIDAAKIEFERRKLQYTTTGKPDLFLRYFLLLNTGTAAQSVGQFLPSTTQWGVPPFAPSTQSLEVMNHGSLVFDFSANDTVVWRGVAQAKIQIGSEPKKREALIREAVKDLARKFPPKS